jgi:hypothetical protein
LGDVPTGGFGGVPTGGLDDVPTGGFGSVPTGDFGGFSTGGFFTGGLKSFISKNFVPRFEPPCSSNNSTSSSSARLSELLPSVLKPDLSSNPFISFIPDSRKHGDTKIFI